MQIDNRWHLSQDVLDNAITEFEMQLWQVFGSFSHWQEECERSTNGTQLTATDLARLHTTRMQDKPKTNADVGRILNRDDMFNIKYSIQKLLKMSLIGKVKNDRAMRTTYYRVTESGEQNTNNYAEIRKFVLINLFNQEKDLDIESGHPAFKKNEIDL